MRDFAKNTDFANNVRNVEFERPFDSISKALTRFKNSSVPQRQRADLLIAMHIRAFDLAGACAS